MKKRSSRQVHGIEDEPAIPAAVDLPENSTLPSHPEKGGTTPNHPEVELGSDADRLESYDVLLGTADDPLEMESPFFLEGVTPHDDVRDPHKEGAQSIARARERRRAWGRRAKSAEEELGVQLDSYTQTDRASRRKRIQASTPGVVSSASERAWEECIVHEAVQTRRVVGTCPIEAIRTAEVSARATGLDALPERGYNSAAESAKQSANRISRYLRTGRTREDAAAHFIIAWPPSITPTEGEAFITMRRYLARLGVDLTMQEIGAWLHHDTEHMHLHVVVGRDRADGGRWCPGIGVDRALALEARLMALEKGQEWDQRMVARSRLSKAGAAMARKGKLQATVRHADGSVEDIPWQGEAVNERVNDDPVCDLAHAGITIAKLVGLRDAHTVAGYCAS